MLSSELHLLAQSKQLCKLRGWEIIFWNYEDSYLSRSDYWCNEAFHFRCDIFRLLLQNKLWNYDIPNHNSMPTGGLLLKEHVHKSLHSYFVVLHIQSALGMPGIRQ